MVYLDQSDQAKVLSSYFGRVTAITLLLLGVGIAVPAAFAWIRGRARGRAEAQLRYLEARRPDRTRQSQGVQR